MTKPVGVNAQLATTCDDCSVRKLTLAYPNEDHTGDCDISKFLNIIEKEKLKILNIDGEMDRLLKTQHGLPIQEFKFQMPNGYIHAAYAPNWVVEGINMYNSMGFEGMPLGEFLQTLTP